MKRFLKLLFLAGIAYGIVWYVREQMVPTPAAPSANAPRFRVPPHKSDEAVPMVAEAAATPDGDDLEAVKGIGPVYAARLADFGINRFSELLEGDADAIAAALDVSTTQVEDWKNQATDLIG